ncbi:MAG: Fur family transcriptional regulator [Desulfobacterales bacterium]|nr:Fur family transcriptional regulator [Desulfobacterales bacterium]
MTKIHSQEKEQFKELFAHADVDNFEDRYRILEVFLQGEDHITAAELADRLEKSGNRFSTDFIQDTLRLMCRFGFAHKNRFDNGQARYEHRHLGDHHDHMICIKCRQIIEFSNDQLEALQLQIASARGFHMLQHRMELYGICNECFGQRVGRMPLVAARQGERLTIEEITGGSGARMRLITMGLRPGDVVDVITNLSDGQIVVALEGKRYALGRGIAQKVMVKPFEKELGAGAGTGDPAEKTRPMSRMKEGQVGTIVKTVGDSLLRRRLLEMGLLKGVDVYVEKYAPLKDPIELIVKGYHISLRVEEADNITVTNVR